MAIIHSLVKRQVSQVIRHMELPIVRGWLVAGLMLAAQAVVAVPPGGEFVVKQAEGAPTVSVGGTVIPIRR